MERLEERRSSTRWKTLHRLDDWLETPMLVLSVAWLGLLLYELGYGNSPLLETFGVAIWVIFAAEFALRLTLAPDKRAFLKGNWLTIAALLVPAVRIFRALRIVRAARALRGVRLERSSEPPTAAWARCVRRFAAAASTMSRR